MARNRRRNSGDSPIGIGTTARNRKKRKAINADTLLDIQPLTKNQTVLFDAYDLDKHLFVYGCAGTGKTFCALYLALKDVLDDLTPYDKIVIVRSLVATREIGFLPGDHEDKSSLYQIPYKNMVKYMFQMPSDADFEMLYGNLKTQGTISFWSTSFIRGTTLDNSIIIVDEFQDTNKLQFDLIEFLAKKSDGITVVGDPNQSVYAFRGSFREVFSFFNNVHQVLTFSGLVFYRHVIFCVQSFFPSRLWRAW